MKVPVHVFTHPTCTTCPQAIRLTQEVAEQDPDIEWRLTSLATPAGRQEAAARQILSVPTILVGEPPIRLVGVPSRTALLQAIARAKAQATTYSFV
ncbi:MAG: thioredoxin family protein [candidate division KSB1 bacterium]|nr:thioredoxin family protein [candidate division KSB1 bacterium]